MKLPKKALNKFPPAVQEIVDQKNNWKRIKNTKRIFIRPGYVNTDAWEVADVTDEGDVTTFLLSRSKGLGGIGSPKRRTEDCYPL